MTRIELKRDAHGRLPATSKGIPDWALEAIKIFRETGKESEVYKTLGIKRRDIGDLMAKNREFAESWSDIFQDQLSRLKESVMHRAVKGRKVGVYYQGGLVATERKPSDALAMFMLKALDPDTYGDKKTLNVHNKSITVQVRRFDENGVEILPDQDVTPLSEQTDEQRQDAVEQSAIAQSRAAERLGKRGKVKEVRTARDLITLDDILGPEVMDEETLDDILGD